MHIGHQRCLADPGKILGIDACHIQDSRVQDSSSVWRHRCSISPAFRQQGPFRIPVWSRFPSFAKWNSGWSYVQTIDCFSLVLTIRAPLATPPGARPVRVSGGPRSTTSQLATNRDGWKIIDPAEAIWPTLLGRNRLLSLSFRTAHAANRPTIRASAWSW